MSAEHSEEIETVDLAKSKIIRGIRKQFMARIETASGQDYPLSDEYIDILYLLLLLTEVEAFNEGDDSQITISKEIVNNNLCNFYIKDCVENGFLQRKMAEMFEIMKEIEQSRDQIESKSEDVGPHFLKRKQSNPRSKYRRRAYELDQKRKQKGIPKLDTTRTGSNKFI